VLGIGSITEGLQDTTSSGGSPPVVTFVSPTPDVAPGSPGGFSASFATATHTPIVVQVTGAVALLVVTVKLLENGDVEAAYRAGFFVGPYTAQSFVSGSLLSIARDAGWPGAPVVGSSAALEVTVDAIDGAGNYVTQTAVYDLPQSVPGVLPATEPTAPIPTAADVVGEALGKIVWQLRSAPF
jgi:hypothetical protein